MVKLCTWELPVDSVGLELGAVVPVGWVVGLEVAPEELGWVAEVDGVVLTDRELSGLNNLMIFAAVMPVTISTRASSEQSTIKAIFFEFMGRASLSD